MCLLKLICNEPEKEYAEDDAVEGPSPVIASEADAAAAAVARGRYTTDYKSGEVVNRSSDKLVTGIGCRGPDCSWMWKSRVELWRY